MPLYEYRCTVCGHVFEKIQSFSAPDEKECPKCQGPVERLLSAPAIQFKGSGFYLTDYGKSGGTGKSGSSAKADSGGKSEGSGSSSAASSSSEGGSSSAASSGSSTSAASSGGSSGGSTPSGGSSSAKSS